MRRLILGIFILIGVQVQAQNFGGFRPKTRWRQINTDTARIIFEAPTKEQAERVATLVHKMAKERPVAIGEDWRKINVVLHKNTTIANGYVALAPFRSELYLIPSSNVFSLGNLPWYEHLAIHEYRHVQQYNNFNRGLTKLFRFVLGEEGQALANSATIPDWFFEGDAVHSETALTPQGRGRLPYFLSGYKSIWEDGRDYRLMKYLNGSLKDYVPNHYQFGYHVVNYGYEKFGADFWQKVTKDAAAFRGLIYPFNKAVRRYSGVRYRPFLRQALASYKEEVKLSPKEEIVHDRTVSNYYFPQFIGDDSLIYLKESYKQLPAFYIQDKNGEHRIKLRNISSEDWFSYRHGVIAYTAYNTNARWSLTDFSDIILLDVTSGKERKLTTISKYFTPDLSPSGDKIIAVSFNESLVTELHVLRSNRGDVVKKIKTSNGQFFLHPRFIDEDNIVVGIREKNGMIALYTLHLTSEKMERLSPSAFSVLGYPSVHNDTIYFTASYKGNDELYAISLKDKKILQLTNTQTGNYYPSVSGNNIVWSKFTVDGLRIRKESLNNMLWSEVNVLSNQVLPYSIALTTENILAAPTRNFADSKYKKGTRLFNFHSWRPYYEDPEFTFSLYGNNVLNTLSSQVFYRYNQNEQSNTVGANFDYAALYPVLRVGAEYTFNRDITIRTPQGVRAGQLRGYELSAGYYLPLNFTQGKTYKSLTFGSNYVFNQQEPIGNTKQLLRSFNTTYLHHFLSWSQQLPRAVQHIYPKFGYALSGAYRHRLDDAGYQSLANGQLYLPSIGNHSIVLTGSFQQVDTSNVLFSNRFNNSRGYTDYYYSKMWRLGANYHFPIVYPDWGFGNLVYFLRIRGNAFYDFTKVYSKDRTQSLNMRSTGGEIYFDTKWWNQMAVTIGVRYSYLLDGNRLGVNRNVWEIVIPTSLIPD